MNPLLLGFQSGGMIIGTESVRLLKLERAPWNACKCARVYVPVYLPACLRHDLRAHESERVCVSLLV